MKTTLKKINKILQEYKKEVNSNFKQLKQNSDKIVEVCLNLDKSWSWSFFGYLAELYFKNFEEPSIKNSFNVEWWWLNWIQDGWWKKSWDEIVEKINNELWENIDTNKLTKDIQDLEDLSKKTKNDILILFSSIDLNDFSNEKKILESIENFDFWKWANYYWNKYWPWNVQTRDSKAFSQWICFPVHRNYLIKAKITISTLESTQIFITITERLIKQLELKNNKYNNYWNYINPFWVVYKLILIIFYILKYIFRFISKNKIISSTFIILSILALNYSLISKNISKVIDYIINLF